MAEPCNGVPSLGCGVGDAQQVGESQILLNTVHESADRLLLRRRPSWRERRAAGSRPQSADTRR
ncbi:hypothetical protein [Streptomyces aquilus]|uniref:hypothetical protein n=1 Tax=Streptomyces aquilus TaxID=2548456 RepID=UPI001416F712|nr:hypothetical protein [Streptomyces aquilus]